MRVDHCKTVINGGFGLPRLSSLLSLAEMDSGIYVELANHKRWYKEHLFSFVSFYWISEMHLFHMRKFKMADESNSFRLSWKVRDIS